MSKQTVKVLLVEDDPDDAFLIHEMLGESRTVDFDLTHVTRLSEATESLDEQHYDIVLLDLTLPDSTGIDTFYKLNASTPRPPIVVLTGLADEQMGTETVRAGAQDYLIKGDVNSDLLIRSVRYAIERDRLEDNLSDALDRLDREFEIIARVQNNLLPSKVPAISGFELTTYYQPAEWAGGDYFDFLSIDPNETGILLADVSGRGAPAAVLMAMTRVIVHEEDNWADPNAVLSTLNQQLTANIPAGRFVTANYGVLNHDDRTFRFSCAGHTPPLILDGATNTVRFLDVESRMPLGIKTDISYGISQVVLEPGSTLVMYTDGVTTAQAHDGSAFGQQRLAEALESNAPETSDDIRDTILNALLQHTGERELTDDTTLVIIRAE
ncbi:MAG: PP2C family protein-serine/threonine phosphatase [Planctomycetota bacterium]